MTLRMQLPSLRHLILLGFFVSLIPLSLLLWQSNAIQRQVSTSSIAFTNNSINTVRLAVETDNLLIDIERGIRQYLILNSDPLIDLARTNIDKYESLLDDLCTLNNTQLAEFCTQQKQDIATLSRTFTTRQQDVLNTEFQTLKKRQTNMMQTLWLFLDDATQEQQTYVSRQQTRANTWLLVIAFVTFCLVVILSRRLAAPVKQLDEKINAIGTGHKRETEKTDSFSGPKEFRHIFAKLVWLDARLQQLEATRQSILRHASHEFKTPLSSILESCSILNDELTGPLTPQQREVITLLEESTLRLQDLTEQLLDYNRFLQQQKPNITDVNPSALLAQIAGDHELLLRKRQQQLTVDCALKEIQTDNTLFTRIVENLLSNAQAYGEQAGRIRIHFYQQGSTLILNVANTGPRIATAHLAHLLEPFYRADVPRHDSLRGNGLGLSIVNDCARLLGGHVELGNDDNFDFMARVTLPIYQETQ